MSHNTWIHRAARAGVKPLAKTAITPNQITTARLITGLGAAAAFAAGQGPWPYVAVALFLLSMILDRADGELARLTGQMSPGGHIYDLVTDAVVNALLFVGIGWGLSDGRLGGWAIGLGLLAGASVACILLLVMRVEAQQGARGAELQSFAGFDPDDAILLVPISVLLGWEQAILIAAAVGAPVFAVFMLWKFRTSLQIRRGAA